MERVTNSPVFFFPKMIQTVDLSHLARKSSDLCCSRGDKFEFWTTLPQNAMKSCTAIVFLGKWWFPHQGTWHVWVIQRLVWQAAETEKDDAWIFFEKQSTAFFHHRPQRKQWTQAILDLTVCGVRNCLSPYFSEMLLLSRREKNLLPASCIECICRRSKCQKAKTTIWIKKTHCCELVKV